MLAHQLFHGIDRVEPARPEVLVVPGVLADGDGQANAVEFDHFLRAGGRKVALLVEDVVKGQQALVLLEQQTAAVEEDGGIERPACTHRRDLLRGPGGPSCASDGSATPARTAVGKSLVAAASSSTAERQRARKLGFSRKSAGG